MHDDDARAIQIISDRLIELGLLQAPVHQQMQEFCERLVALGLPLHRGNVSARTMHPLIDSVSNVWRRGRGVETSPNTLEQATSPRWLQSPMRALVESADTRLKRSDLTDPRETERWPVFAEFRAAGATEHLAKLVSFGLDGATTGNTGVMMTWTTDRQGGFAERDVAILERLMPRLALSVKSSVDYEIAQNLLRAYVGRHASGEILAGAYRRGSFRMIPAIILITDLKGFTTLANRVDQKAVTQVLNQCFDAMVAPIRDHGGEVLKFLGDGLLAVFEHRGNEEADLCLEALNAAREAVDAVGLIERPGEPDVRMQLDAALHLGEVFYGNVGAADRLDFTILGPAVNEASRIESLCTALGHPILMSQSFADKAQSCRGQMVRWSAWENTCCAAWKKAGRFMPSSPKAISRRRDIGVGRGR